MWTFLNATSLYSAIVDQDRQRERSGRGGRRTMLADEVLLPPDKIQMTYNQRGSAGGSFNTWREIWVLSGGMKGWSADPLIWWCAQLHRWMNGSVERKREALASDCCFLKIYYLKKAANTQMQTLSITTHLSINTFSTLNFFKWEMKLLIQNLYKLRDGAQLGPAYIWGRGRGRALHASLLTLWNSLWQFSLLAKKKRKKQIKESCTTNRWQNRGFSFFISSQKLFSKEETAAEVHTGSEMGDITERSEHFFSHWRG